MSHYIPVKKKTVEERLWAKTRSTANGCLLWTGTTNGRGYPQISVRGKVLMATKLVWSLYHGYEPTRPLLQRCGSRQCLSKECLYEKPNGEVTGHHCVAPGPCRTCGETIERGQPYVPSSNNSHIRHHVHCAPATIPDYSGPEYQYDPTEARELSQCL